MKPFPNEEERTQLKLGEIVYLEEFSACSITKTILLRNYVTLLFHVCLRRSTSVCPLKTQFRAQMINQVAVEVNNRGL
jgi:hypothetical protein